MGQLVIRPIGGQIRSKTHLSGSRLRRDLASGFVSGFVDLPQINI
jgi:hypothetical protein